MSAAQRPERPQSLSTGIYTDTLARLYMQQGFFDQALEIYQHLAQTQPRNRQWRERIAALEQQRAAAATAARVREGTARLAEQQRGAPHHELERRLLGHLERWLRTLRQQRLA